MSAIEQYLTDLDDELRVGLWRRERILAEVRSHLEQTAAETEERDRVSPAEAERCAVAAFGSPEQVAAGFDTKARSALAGSAAALSDLSYRVARNPQALRDFAGAVVAGALSWAFFALVIGVGWGAATGAFGGSMSTGFKALRALKPAPRPGYVRRWRKLDQSARSQVAAALRSGSAPSEPIAADLAVEVRQRVRGLRNYLAVFFAVFVAVLLATAYVIDAAARGKPSAAAVAIVLAVAAVAYACWDWPSARRQVETELAALEAVEEVTGEALREGSARLEERPLGPLDPCADRCEPKGRDRTRLRFELAPENPKACAVSLMTSRRALELWLGPDRFRHKIKRRHGDHLHELHLCLAAVVAGRYREEWRLVEVHRRFPLRDRRCTQVTGVFETKEGTRSFTHRWYSKAWVEWWRAWQAEYGDAPAREGVWRSFAPYRDDA